MAYRPVTHYIVTQPGHGAVHTDTGMAWCTVHSSGPGHHVTTNIQQIQPVCVWWTRTALDVRGRISYTGPTIFLN